MKTFFRHLVALLVGYLVAGLTYVAILTLGALANISLVDPLYAVVALVSFAVWIGVYIHLVRRWGRKDGAPAPPATPT